MKEKDYGCNPLPDGKYKMVPSGDIVSYEEKLERLQHIHLQGLTGSVEDLIFGKTWKQLQADQVKK